MDPNLVRAQFSEGHRDLPPNQIVTLVGSHRRVVWPQLCPACGAPASVQINVAKIFARQSRYGGFSNYRYLVRMPVPFCRSCANRHEQLVGPVPSMVGSFFRTPALLSFIAAAVVGGILWSIFVQGGEDVSLGARTYAISGIVLLVATGFFITANAARFLRVPKQTEVTRACDFSDNVGFPFGRRRLYAIRNAGFAEAFIRANQDRLWTDAMKRRDRWISLVVFVLLILATIVAVIIRS